jgi:ribonuclease P protein component
VSDLSSSRTRAVGRVRDRRTFGALRRDGARHRSGPVTVTVVVDDIAPRAHVAYAVGRAVGGAVERNRLRRRLRAIVRDAELAPGAYLISVAPSAARLTFDELAGHVTAACRR